MLKVIVEMWPGGRERVRRVLATAEIARIKVGAHADYEVRLQEEVLGDVGSGVLHQYPRFAGSVWDLVARGIVIALSGYEKLPHRPSSPSVPVHWSDDIPYVRTREIPEPARSLFLRNVRASSMLMIEEGADITDCVYAWDFEAFLAGYR